MNPTPAIDLLRSAELPAAWARRPDFVLLSAGCDGGEMLSAVQSAWHADPLRCQRLHLVLLLPEAGRLPAAEGWVDAPGLQRLQLEDGGLTVDVLRGRPLRDGLRALRLRADALLLDGEWDGHLLRRLAQLAAPQATLAAPAQPGLAPGLMAAGFELLGSTAAPLVQARYAPRFQPRGDAVPPRPAAAGEAVLVLGAGLAGAACARALARAGLRVTVLERHDQPAQQASGNPGGLFHGIVHPQDGMHARFSRAAALHTARMAGPWIGQGQVPGRIDGLLRLRADGPGAAAMQAQADALGLPAGYVQALDAAGAAQASGLPLQVPAWFYPGGGWLDPRALVRQMLAQPGITLRTGAAVARIRSDGTDGWQACDAQGRVLGQARHLVLCNAGDTLALLADLGADWPMAQQRGQLTVIPADTPGLRRPLRPVAGGGYVLGLPDGSVLCGATAQAGDTDAALRPADEAANLLRYAAITGAPLRAPTQPLPGRTAFRLLAADRLPVVGPVPQPGALHDQPRRVPRLPGLHVCTALGSRGITWAPLLGEVLAAWVTGLPAPLEADLLDAIDPARFAARQARRRGG